MKLAIVVLLLVATCQLIQAAHVNDLRVELLQKIVTRSLGDKFKAALEEFRNMMKQGNAKIGLPVLEPLAVEHKKIEIKEEKANAKGEVNDLYVEGLSDYVVNDADFKFAKLIASMDLTWNGVKGNTSYEIDGYLMNKFPFYGAGDLSFEINGLRFATQAALKINYLQKKVSIVSFNATSVALEKIKVDMTGLYNNDELSQLVSAVIGDVVPEGIVDFQDEITKELNQLLLKHGNEILSQLSLEDIMGLIS